MGTRLPAGGPVPLVRASVARPLDWAVADGVADQCPRSSGSGGRASSLPGWTHLEWVASQRAAAIADLVPAGRWRWPVRSPGEGSPGAAPSCGAWSLVKSSASRELISGALHSACLWERAHRRTGTGLGAGLTVAQSGQVRAAAS